MISRPYKPNWGLSQPSGHGDADTETAILGSALQKALVEQSGRLHMLEIIAKHHAHIHGVYGIYTKHHSAWCRLMSYPWLGAFHMVTLYVTFVTLSGFSSLFP